MKRKFRMVFFAVVWAITLAQGVEDAMVAGLWRELPGHHWGREALHLGFAAVWFLLSAWCAFFFIAGLLAHLRRGR